MPHRKPPEKLHFLRALGMPIAIVLFFAFGIMMLADKFLHHALTMAIFGYAEDNAKAWTQKMVRRVPDLVDAIASGGANFESRDDVVESGKANDIFRFKLFAPDGQLLIVSDDPDFVPDPANMYANATVREVFETGISNGTMESGAGNPDRPATYVELYLQAVTEDGVPFGVIELYVDTSDLSHSLHDIFHILSRLLIIGCAVLYLIPSIFFILRGEKIRIKDQHLVRLSLYDSLTGVLNRRAFSNHSKALFEDRKDFDIGVIFVDVDRFKDVNDELGHEFGDNLLRYVANVMKAHLGPDDTIGRLGGDEFIIMCPFVTQNELVALADQIKSSLYQAFTHKGTTLTLTVSMGLYLSSPGEDEDWAIHAADLALYRAKSEGRGQIVEFTQDLDNDLRRRRHIESRMREVLSTGGGFFIEYQPIFDAHGALPVGFEALLRLRDSDGSLISPVEFIPIAEESGLINEIGQFVLRQVLTVSKDWPRNQFVAVNLSAVQFKNGDIVKVISDILAETGFDPGRLNLEVTESLLLDNEDTVSMQLKGLRKLGVSVALDDFGTGFSSLGYLWKFQFDTLKIDRMFLKGFDQDSERYKNVITTIVMLGHALGMKVTAEGVENDVQFSMLRKMGCNQFQGFMLGRPMPEADALQLATGEATNQKSA